MAWTKLIMVLLTYAVLFVLFYSIGERVKLGKWVRQNTKSSFKALIISAIIYFIGYVVIQKLYVGDSYYYITNGILISVPMIIIYHVSHNIFLEYCD